MKFLHLFLAGIALCTFSACEKQPKSKVESMTADYADKAHEANTVEKSAHQPAR